MNHLRNGAKKKIISPHYVSDPHDTRIASVKPAQRAFYDHSVTYLQNRCTETAFAEGNGTQGHQNLKCECINHQNVSFYLSFMASTPC
jgi:hypothetical protein